MASAASDLLGVRLLCREGDAKILASYVGEVFRAGFGRNVFVYGKPGTGKTLLVQYILGEARKYVAEESVRRKRLPSHRIPLLR